MGATKGNEFWKQRASHGRDKIFSSPEILWQMACEYFKWCDDQPWIRIDYKGKDAVECKIPTSRPYTLTGLCFFLDIDENTWIRYRKEEPYKDYWEVVRRVDQVIYTRKFEGAVVGAYNANIIARDLGLIDKKDITSDGKPIDQVFKIGDQEIKF